MLNIFRTNIFKRDFKKADRQNKPLEILREVITLLINEELLPEKYKDHNLSGNYGDHRECHLQPDWLLIYKIEDDTLFLVRLGSHSNLF